MDIYFNNKYSSEFDIEVIARPAIPISKNNYEIKNINGTDGNYYINKNTVDDITIPIDLNFLDTDDIEQKIIKISNWLNYIEDNKLIIGRSQFYYKVKCIEASDIEDSGNYTIKKFTVNFICEGYKYLLNDYEMELDSSKVINNMYSLTKPLYYITGNGALNINGNTVTISNNSNDTIIINTVIGKVTDIKGNVITGRTNINYMQDLLLKHGENKISFSGIKLRIKPNYRTR